MKLTAIIERGQDGGFAVCVREMPWLIGYGLTEAEAKTDFLEVFSEQAEYYQEKHGVLPAWHDAEIEYRYDISAFFLAFPFINVSEFARCIGINPSLMRKYKQGIASASDKQLSIIQSELQKMVSKLQSVHL